MPAVKLKAALLCAAIAFAAALIAASMPAKAQEVEVEDNSLVVRQLIDGSGQSSLEVIVNGKPIEDSPEFASFKQLIYGFVPPVVYPSRATKSDIRKLAAAGYIDNSAFVNHIGEPTAQLAKVLEVDGGIVNLEQQVQVWVPVLNKYVPGVVEVSGFGFYSDDSANVYHRDAVVHSEGVYMVANYHPQNLFDPALLEDADYATTVQAQLAELTELNDSLVYQLFTTKDNMPATQPVTLFGYGVDIQELSADGDGEVTIYADEHGNMEAKCVAGYATEDMLRFVVEESAAATVTLAVEMTPAECANETWTSGAAGAPRAVFDLVEEFSADYAYLVENKQWEPAEWVADGDGFYSPVTYVTVQARNLDYSCFETSYSQNEWEMLPMRSAQQVYLVTDYPARNMQEVSQVALATVDVRLRDELIVANEYGQQITVYDEGSTYTMPVPRFPADFVPAEFYSPMVYDSKAGYFTRPGIVLPPLNYEYEIINPAEPEHAPNSYGCLVNSMHKYSIKLRTDNRVCGRYRTGYHNTQVCTTGSCAGYKYRINHAGVYPLTSRTYYNNCGGGGGGGGGGGAGECGGCGDGDSGGGGGGGGHDAPP